MKKTKDEKEGTSLYARLVFCVMIFAFGVEETGLKTRAAFYNSREYVCVHSWATFLLKIRISRKSQQNKATFLFR